MRKNLVFAVLTLFSVALLAQDCDFYIPLEEGKGFKYQNFNHRDREDGSQEMIIKSVILHDDHTEAIIETRYYNRRDRLQHEGEYSIRCKGNEMVLDIQSMLDPDLMEGFEGMEVSFTTTDLTIPNNVSVGDQLPDGIMEIKVSAGGMTMTEMDFTTRNRKVQAMEEITTPAGTFECYKITYENFIDTQAMGFSRKSTSLGVEYYAPGVGMVRSELYDENENLESYTVLSEIY